MRRTLLYCVLPFIFFACKKSSQPSTPPKDDNKKTYAVHFNVNGTGASTLKAKSLYNLPKTLGSVPVSSYATKLYYWVFSSSGTLVSQLIQDNTQSNFGVITDTFAPGTYNIVFFAQNCPSSAYLYLPISSGVPDSYFSAEVLINGYDTFFKTFPLTVSNAPVTQDITLTRVVGQLKIVLTDSIPDEATAIHVQIKPTQAVAIANGLPVTWNFDNTGGITNIDISLPDSVKGKKNYTITAYIANAANVPFNVALTATNSSGVFASANVDSVYTQVNKQTILSGNLFLHEAAAGFSIAYNNTWNYDPVIPFKVKTPAFTKQSK